MCCMVIPIILYLTDACYFGESIVIRRGGDVDSDNVVVKFESVYSIDNDAWRVRGS